MLIGAHVSAAGGLHNAPENAAKIGAECFQFFSRPPQGGRVSVLTDEAVSQFRGACEKHGFEQCYVHTPYIINLASQEARVRNNSIEIIRTDLDRAAALGVTAIMTHVGSATGGTREDGIKSVAEGVKAILKGYKGTTRFLIEISAGAGNVIGSTFEEIAEILKIVGDDGVGICFDTAHAFASGYDLRNKEAVQASMSAFENTIGKGRLMISHCNDSMVELGAKKDRHEHIGKGFIGKAGFEAIIASPYFKEVNLILETPPEGVVEDLALLKTMRDGV